MVQPLQCCRVRALQLWGVYCLSPPPCTHSHVCPTLRYRCVGCLFVCAQRSWSHQYDEWHSSTLLSSSNTVARNANGAMYNVRVTAGATIAASANATGTYSKSMYCPLATDNLLENTNRALRPSSGVGAPRQCSLGAAACCLLCMLTRAILMTSSFQRAAQLCAAHTAHHGIASS